MPIGSRPGDASRRRSARERTVASHAEFVRAQRSGRRVSTPHFVLLVAVQPRSGELGEREAGEAAQPRLGIVTSRKIGGAVQRNRVRRLCRECFRIWPDGLPRGIDLIVIARPGADKLSLGGVRTEWLGVERLLRKRAAEALAQGAPRHHPPAT